MKRTTLILGSIAVLGILGGAYAYAASTIDPNQAVESVATQAVVLDHAIPFYYRLMSTNTTSDLGLVNANQFEGVNPTTPIRSLISMLPTQPNLTNKVQFSSSDLTAWSNKANNLIGSIFLNGSDAYNKEVSELQSVQSTINKGDVLPVDGGIRQLHWDSVTIKNGTATLVGMGDSWASYGHWQNGAYAFASPHNEIVYTVTLQQQNNAWKVTNLSWEFAPGSQP